MNFYAGAFIISWLAFLVAGEKKLLKWGILSGAFGFIHELTGIYLKLWTYNNNFRAVSSNTLGVYPVTGILFLTFLPPSPAGRVLYILLWTVVSLILEMAYVLPGHLVYIRWIIPYSFLLYMGSYSLYTAVYLYINARRTVI